MGYAVPHPAAQRRARNTYEYMIGALRRLKISDENRQKLETLLAALKTRLIELGETFPTPDEAGEEAQCPFNPAV